MGYALYIQGINACFWSVENVSMIDMFYLKIFVCLDQEQNSNNANLQIINSDNEKFKVTKILTNSLVEHMHFLDNLSKDSRSNWLYGSSFDLIFFPCRWVTNLKFIHFLL